MEKIKDVTNLPKPVKKKPMPNFVSRKGDWGDDYSDQEMKQMKAWNEELKSNFIYRK